MSKVVKFASQIDEQVLTDLKRFAKASDRSISGVLTEAVADYLKRERIRPAFRKVSEEVLIEHAELLSRLAK